MPLRKQKSVVPLMLRLPADLHRTLARDAEKKGHSLNSEIIERLNNPILFQDDTQRFQRLAEQTATSTVNQILQRIDFSGAPKKATSKQGDKS
jgi:Arc-like DNA binding dprotein